MEEMTSISKTDKAVHKPINSHKRLGCLTIILAIILLKIGWVCWMCYGNSSFETEKPDILKRRRYLINQTMVTPQRLLDSMPADIGTQFQGEWALFTYSMLSGALINIANIFPETKEESVQIVDSLITRVMSPEIRQYDTDRWGEDPLESLDGDNSHISYISHLAWMISHFKFLGGSDKYDTLFQKLCATMDRRMFQHESLCLQTYPGESIYVPDMLVAIAALSNYARLYDGKYSKTVGVWLKKAQSEFIDPKTGLLSSFLTEDGKMYDPSLIKGSYSALNSYYLTFIDKEFAAGQYEKFKKIFLQTFPITGFKEYSNGCHVLSFDIDAGLIVFNLSPTGTAFAIGSVTYNKDFKLRKKLLYTAELAGCSVSSGKEKHYLLANVALVGEAIVLAMKTTTEWNRF